MPATSTSKDFVEKEQSEDLPAASPAKNISKTPEKDLPQTSTAKDVTDKSRARDLVVPSTSRDSQTITIDSSSDAHNLTIDLGDSMDSESNAQEKITEVKAPNEGNQTSEELQLISSDKNVKCLLKTNTI